MDRPQRRLSRTMDSSPRDLERGSPRPPDRRAPAPALPSLDLADWLRGQDKKREERRRWADCNRDEPTSRDERLARAAAYLTKIPPAVSGERGHDRTFHAACVLVQGFDLTIDDARPLLHKWSLACVPPCSHAELEHKLHA